MLDEGVEIPEDLKYFPYRATYDFECYFKRETDHPQNTAKLTWEGSYEGYDQPKCFVSSENTGDIIQQFVDYLVEISQESYRLLLHQLLKATEDDLFEAIRQCLLNI